MAYLKETQKSSIAHITRLSCYRKSQTLSLDEMTRRGLELTKTLRDGAREGSLLHTIDRTVTPMGARLLAKWLTSPLATLDPIRARHAAVAEFVNDASFRADVRHSLGLAYDLERLASRVGTARATPRDLVALAKTLAALPKLKARLAARQSPLLNELESRLELCPEVRASIDAALVHDPPLALKEGGLIRDGYHPDLDELREISRGGKSWIARFQAEQIRNTGINSLKVGFNKVFGYYIEVSNVHGAKVPADYIRKQTVKNAERYITPELKEYEDKVLRRRACERVGIRAFRDLARSNLGGCAPARSDGRRAGATGCSFVVGRTGRAAGILPSDDDDRSRARNRGRPPSRARRRHAARSVRAK